MRVASARSSHRVRIASRRPFSGHSGDDKPRLDPLDIDVNSACGLSSLEIIGLPQTWHLPSKRIPKCLERRCEGEDDSPCNSCSSATSSFHRLPALQKANVLHAEGPEPWPCNASSMGPGLLSPRDNRCASAFQEEYADLCSNAMTPTNRKKRLPKALLPVTFDAFAVAQVGRLV